MQDDRPYEIDEIEDEYVELDIDQLDDVSSSKFFTRAEYNFAKMEDHHDTDCSEHE